jgi:anaerobic dimethyl sulfoxide reductase subunit A
MWLNPEDADARGLKNGDRAKVFNDRGEIYIDVKVTAKIMPGVAGIPQGAWFTPDHKGIDQRGSINVLTNQRPTPLAKANPQLTNLADVQKA